jgi:hypothetical protein
MRHLANPVTIRPETLDDTHISASLLEAIMLPDLDDPMPIAVTGTTLTPRDRSQIAIERRSPRDITSYLSDM